MGQTDDIADLVIKLRADVQELTASMEAARGVVAEKTGQMKDSFDDLKRDLLEVFSAEKIKEFFMEGLKDFADFDRLLTVGQFNLQRFGQATADSKEQMAEWADGIQAATLFTKTEAITTLNKLTLMTHDLAAGLKLSKLAMDLSAASGVPLEAVTLALGNAYEGNNQGLGRFVRNFPDLKRVLAEGGDAIEYLTKQADGMAEKIGQAGLAGQLFHLKTAWGEVAEDFVKHNQGAVSDAVRGLTGMAEIIAWLLSLFGKLGETIGIVLGGLAMGLEHIKTFLTGGWKQYTTEVASDNKAFFEELDKVWKSGEEKAKKFGKGMADGAIHAKAAMKESAAEIIRSVQEMFDQLEQKRTMSFSKAMTAYKDGELKLVKGVKETESEFKKRVEDMKALHKAAADYIEKTSEKLAAAVAKTAQSAASEMAKAYKDGTLTVGKAFEIMGKSIFKSLVMSVGEALIQSGAADIATGTADLLNPVLAAASPGFFASGFAKEISGGSIVGVAEAALADGGYVTKPTIALLGEAGPEKVTPLSGGHPLDEGGGLTVKDGVHLHYHGVKDAKDAMSSGRATKSGHDLLTAIDAQRRRQGLRYKRGGR